MAKETHYKIGTIGTAVLAAYLGLAGSIGLANSPFSPQPAYADNRQGLESKVRDVHHGIKDGRYYADVTISVRNNCADITEELWWYYSLCFETAFKGGKVGIQCADGKAEKLEGLKRGEEQTRKARLKLRSRELTIDFQVGDEKKTVHIRGQRPKINVRLEGNSRLPLYERNHYLSPVGNYR